MRNILKGVSSTSLFTILAIIGNTQTPKVGIGTNSPNEKSILHLEAPFGNQGLLLPRLTTAQMEDNSFKSSLGNPEKGLMVYDVNRNQMYAWNGTSWKSSANISFPYIDSVENFTNFSNMVRLINKGNSGNAVGILYLENRDQNNSFSPLLITTNSKVQGAADLLITNPENATNGLDVTHRGIGTAGNFVVNNTASTVAALNATTNGIAGSVAVRGMATNNGTGVAAFSNGNGFISPAIYAEQSGTGDAAGVFKLTNAGNNYNAVYGETLGGGFTFFALQKGTGRAGQFQINNNANADAAVRGITDGLGRAGFFTINNVDNSAAAISANTNGKGNAGYFEVNNSSSTVAALNATTNGIAGSVAVRGMATNNGTGVAAFSNGNGFISPAIYAEQSGTGDAAGVFKLTNAGNNYNAVFGETLGGGATFFALQKGTGRGGQFQINNVTNNEVAVRAFTDGLGRAGYFSINNASSQSDAVFASTNATAGSGLGAENLGNGNALTIWGGGLKLSTATLNAGTSVSTRAAAYEITGGGPYTIGFPLQNGETFFFYNNTGVSQTVNGTVINANSGKTCIVLNGVLRAM